MSLTIEYKRKLQKLNTADHDLLLKTKLCAPIEFHAAAVETKCDCCDKPIKIGEDYVTSWGYSTIKDKGVFVYIRCSNCFEKILNELRLD